MKFSFRKIAKPASSENQTPVKTDGGCENNISSVAALPPTPQTTTGGAAAAAAAAVSSSTSTNSAVGNKPRTVFSLKYDPLRYRPRPESCATTEEERKVGGRIDVGINELARRIMANYFPHHSVCLALLAALQESDSCKNMPIWQKLESQLRFGELSTLQMFANAVRRVFATESVNQDAEDEFERDMHTKLLPLVAPAVRSELEIRELSDHDFKNLGAEARERVISAAVAIDGEKVRLFWRTASYPARRRVRVLIEQIKAEAEAEAQRQQEMQKNLMRAHLLAQQQQHDQAQIRAQQQQQQQQPPLRNQSAAGQLQQQQPQRPAPKRGGGKKVDKIAAMQITDLRPKGNPVAVEQNQQPELQHKPASVGLNTDLLFGGPPLEMAAGGAGNSNNRNGFFQQQQQPPFEMQQQQPQMHQHVEQEDTEHRLPANRHDLGNMFGFEEHNDDEQEHLAGEDDDDDDQMFLPPPV